jgi:lipase
VIHEHPAAAPGHRGTLVLLHGITDSGRCWPDAVPRWTAAGWRVLACDARGHGDAPRWGHERPPGDVMVDDVVDLLERERGGRVVIIGHSMGAAVGVAAAARRPDRVRAVVAEDPPWALPAGELAAERLADLRDGYRQVIALGRSERIARQREETPGWSTAERESWAVAKEQFDERLLADGGVLPSPPWPGLVAALRDHGVPLLLVTGDRGVEVGDDVAREAARLGARVVRVSGAGHCVRRDRPSGYHAAVDPFVTGAAPA